MKKMTKLAAAGAGLALVAGMAVATPALASTITAGDDVRASCPGGWPGALWSKLPDDLKTDLENARDAAPGADRRAAFQAIRDKAAAGDYGDVVERIAQAHPGFGVGLWREAPKALRDDIRAALAQTGDAREQAFAQIGQKALAGDYGTEVQTRAQKVQNEPWWPDCAG